MKIVILAAGKGVRMLPLTADKPKHLIQIAGKPFLWYVLKNIMDAGIHEIVIIANYKIEMIREFIEKGGYNAVVVDQGEPLGTAHAIGKAENEVDGDFIVLMGDNFYSPPDIQGIARAGDDNYIGAIRHEHPEKYGNLLIDEDCLKSIVEKPPKAVSNYINAGLYKFKPEIFDAIRKIGKSLRGEYEITDAIALLAQERKVKVYMLKGYWKDFGKPEDLPVLEEFIKNLNAGKE